MDKVGLRLAPPTVAYRKSFYIVMFAATLCIHPASLHAQRISQIRTKPSSAGGAIVTGLLMGGLGFVGGALVGVAAGCTTNSSCIENEVLEGALVGAIIGEILLLPIGVHIGNRQAGSLGVDLVASLLGGLSTVGIVFATNSESLFWIGAIGQVALTVTLERSIGRRRSENIGLILNRTSNGRFLAGVRIRQCVIGC